MADRYIPFEIQAEIMKRLPVKILIRFTSVSKPWNSLIRSSKFIRDCHAIPHRLLIRYFSQGVNNLMEEKYVSIVDDDSFHKQKLPMIIPMSVKRIYSPMIVCSSHGLFCFHDSFSP
nr:hypothetical protein [Tanacetum cinerariifolium]